MAGMRPDDVYDLTWVGDARISPDGASVAYVVTSVDREENGYRSAIWVVPLAGGTPVQFTAGKKRDAAPRWSPDGKWRAFTWNRGEDKAPGALYVIPAQGGEPRKLTDLKEGVEGAGWSPDSTRIAVASGVRDAEYEEEDER